MKSDKIKTLFDSIAHKYDRANRVITFGLDSVWRKKLVKWSEVGGPAKILDGATGTGALAFAFAKARPKAKVVGVDFSLKMLQKARELNALHGLQVEFREADIMALPFADNSFDVSAVAYGIRNMENPVLALKELARVTKPGGYVMILETGRPALFLYPLFYFYFRFIMPWLGGWVTGKKSAYDYLEQSSIVFPSRKNFLKLLKSTGAFSTLQYKTLLGGASFLYKAQVSPPLKIPN